MLKEWKECLRLIPQCRKFLLYVTQIYKHSGSFGYRHRIVSFLSASLGWSCVWTVELTPADVKVSLGGGRIYGVSFLYMFTLELSFVVFSREEETCRVESCLCGCSCHYCGGEPSTQTKTVVLEPLHRMSVVGVMVWGETESTSPHLPRPHSFELVQHTLWLLSQHSKRSWHGERPEPWLWTFIVQSLGQWGKSWIWQGRIEKAPQWLKQRGAAILRTYS